VIEETRYNEDGSKITVEAAVDKPSMSCWGAAHGTSVKAGGSSKAAAPTAAVSGTISSECAVYDVVVTTESHKTHVSVAAVEKQQKGCGPVIGEEGSMPHPTKRQKPYSSSDHAFFGS
jgi:hypothetical protein